MEPTTGSANLPIQRSWTRRMGTGFRKWRFSRPDPLGRDEIRLLQDREVLHDPEPRHPRQVPAQLAERLAIALEEPVEQDPPIRIGERPEDRDRVVRHAIDYM